MNRKTAPFFLSGPVIKYHCARLGLTQTRIAEQLEVSRPRMSTILCGNLAAKRDLVERIAALLGVDFDSIVDHQSTQVVSDVDFDGE